MTEQTKKKNAYTTEHTNIRKKKKNDVVVIDVEHYPNLIFRC